MQVITPGLSVRQLGRRLFVRSAPSLVTGPTNIQPDARKLRKRAIGSEGTTRAADAVGEDTDTFPSGLAGGVNPTFVGYGSKIEQPELLVVFWGTGWPGSGAITQAGLMAAFNSIVNGPYLSGLSQYGYVGPVSVRAPQTWSAPHGINLAPLAPGVTQSTNVWTAVLNFVEDRTNDGWIGGTDDNHDLIVMVIIDSSLRFPQDQSSTGALTTVFGAHGKLEIFELLDDNTRFAVGWVGTGAGGIGQPDQTTASFSHELAEAITDPFPSSGWVQTSPTPPAGSNEIGDVCNNQAARLDGVTVAAYWSVADQKCIVPTEHRACYLTQAQTRYVPHDGPERTVHHDFGAPLCASGDYTYVERTYDNEFTVQAQLTGYQAPSLTWTVNGVSVPNGNSTMIVPAYWEDAGELRYYRHGYVPLHPPTATLRVRTAPTSLVIDAGPYEGNTDFDVGLTVVEAWDNVPAVPVQTQKVASTHVYMINQEIDWGQDYLQALKDCRKRRGLTAGPVFHFGPRDPGDPERGGPVEYGPEISRAILAALERGPDRINRLRTAAAEIAAIDPELAATLSFMAEHPRTQRR